MLVQPLRLGGNMEELIRLAEEINKELNHTDDAKSREICFEAFCGGWELNFGMQMIWIFNSPMLILGRCGGGESFSWCIEDDEEIEWTIKHFFEVNNLEFLQIF